MFQWSRVDGLQHNDVVCGKEERREVGRRRQAHHYILVKPLIGEMLEVLLYTKSKNFCGGK